MLLLNPVPRLLPAVQHPLVLFFPPLPWVPLLLLLLRAPKLSPLLLQTWVVVPLLL